VLGGFDTHDTHHAISAYTADPSGAFIMCEGVFLHSNVETPYGPVRCVDGGFFRYSPQRGQLERTIQLSIPNPWGFVFDLGPGFLPPHLRHQHELDAARLREAYLRQQNTFHT
jgi:hypothetical protein